MDIIFNDILPKSTGTAFWLLAPQEKTRCSQETSVNLMFFTFFDLESHLKVESKFVDPTDPTETPESWSGPNSPNTEKTEAPTDVQGACHLESIDFKPQEIGVPR